MNDLLQKRAALEVELKTLETEIPRLQSHWRNMPSTFNHLGNEVGHPESRAAMDAASSAEARSRCIPQEIERIDVQIHHQNKVANIQNAKKESRRIMAESADIIKELEARHLGLVRRLEDTQTDAEKTLLRAQNAENVAATAYAQAVASNDSEHEKTAMLDIQKAAKQLINVQENDRRQQLLINALQVEVDKTYSLIGETQKNYDHAKSQALDTAYLALSVEWDVAVEQLAYLGAKIIATSSYNDRSYNGLSDVKLPQLAPSKKWAITYKDLSDRAGAVSLTSILSA